MSGVLVLALPITIIVDNFIKVAQEEQQQAEMRLEQVDDEYRQLIVRSNRVERRASAAVVSALVV
jgi:hypothetical protein